MGRAHRLKSSGSKNSVQIISSPLHPERLFLIAPNRYETLQISEGIGTAGALRWELVGCLALSWLAVFLCLFRGVQTLGKVSPRPHQCKVFRKDNSVEITTCISGCVRHCDASLPHAIRAPHSWRVSSGSVDRTSLLFATRLQQTPRIPGLSFYMLKPFAYLSYH